MYLSDFIFNARFRFHYPQVVPVNVFIIPRPPIAFEKYGNVKWLKCLHTWKKNYYYNTTNNIFKWSTARNTLIFNNLFHRSQISLVMHGSAFKTQYKHHKSVMFLLQLSQLYRSKDYYSKISIWKTAVKRM